MKSSHWLIIGISFVYLAIVAGTIYFLRWKRRSRWPFKMGEKLLRGPGESLRRKITQLDEQFAIEAFWGFGAALFAFALVGDDLTRILKIPAHYGLLLAILALVAGFGISAWRLGRLWRQRQQFFLGYYGERYVAEWLEPAKIQGWRVFHDVPFTNNGKTFNIDHIVLGDGGVFALETKTRRKGNARPGRKDSDVSFDGRELDWPWGSDTHGLDQAERNAQYLSDWIKDEIGERVFVTPMLVLPGWWLTLRPTRESRPCRVVNPKWLPGVFEKERPILDPKLAALIARRLDARCRDVED